jgi:hypothetical protein
MKNIYNNVGKNDIYNAERNAMNALHLLNNTQNGGGDEFKKILENYGNKKLEEFLSQQKTVKDYIIVSLKFIDYVQKMIENTKLDDVEQLTALLSEMKKILTKHLEKS